MNTQNSAEETHKQDYPSELIDRRQLDNTPFIMVNTVHGWFVTLGDYRITEPYQTELEAIEHLEKRMWYVVLQMIGCALDRFDEKAWHEKTEELIENEKPK